MKWHAEPITLATDNGTLQGELLIPEAEGPLPGAVLCHGGGTDHRAMRPSAQRLARQGIATLAFNFRGHGRGDSVLDGDLEKDVLAALEFMRHHPRIDPDRIALVGHSLGALAAIQAAAEQKHLRALVSLSSPSLMIRGMEKVPSALYHKAVKTGSLLLEFPRIGPIPGLGKIPGLIAMLWMWIRGYRLRIHLQDSLKHWGKLRPSVALEKLGALPKLFVHSRGDRLAPYEVALELYEKAGPPKEFMLAEGGSHATPLLPGKLRKRWISWLVSVLTRDRGDEEPDDRKTDVVG